MDQNTLTKRNSGRASTGGGRSQNCRMPLDAPGCRPLVCPDSPGHVPRKTRSEHRGSRSSPTKPLPPLPAVRNKAEKLPDRVAGSTRGNRSTEKYSGTIPADAGPTRIGRATTPRSPLFGFRNRGSNHAPKYRRRSRGCQAARFRLTPPRQEREPGHLGGARRAGLPRGGGISMRFGQPLRPIHLPGESGLVAFPVPVSRRVSRPTPW